MIGGLALLSALATLPLSLPEAATTVCAAVPESPDASRALAATLRAKAVRLRDSRDWAAAAATLRIAVAVSPRDAQLWHELAQLEVQLNQPLAAEAAWRQAIGVQADQPMVRMAFAEFLMLRANGGDLDQAAELALRAQREPGSTCLAARIAALRGLCDDADRHWPDCQRNPARKPARLAPAELHLARGRCRFARGEYDAAESAWEQAQVAGAEVTALLAQLGEARRKVGVEARPEDRKAMATVTELARAALQGLDRGQEPPDRGLERAVTAAPAVGVGHLALGEIAIRQGRLERGEFHLLRALALPVGDGDRARALRALGRLCATSFAEPRWAEAAAFWTAAAPLEDLPHAEQMLWLEALRRTGQLRAAHRLVTRMLAQATDSSRALAADVVRELRAQKLALEAVGGAVAGEQLTPAESTAPSGPRDRARLLARADRMVEAVAVVRAELRDGPAKPELWRDLAHYQRAMGDGAAARESLVRALELRESQGDVHWTLARWQIEAGEDAAARRHIARADSLGVAAAVPLAVRADLDDHLSQGWAVRVWDRATPAALSGRLDRLLARDPAALSEPDRAADLANLRHAIDAELRLAAVARGAGALFALVACAIWAWRRWGGATLRSLVIAHPDTGPEVQRIVAAVRHEVIKHNTLWLGTAVDALLAGDRETALRTVRPLVAEGDSPRDKLADYAAQLEHIGRARGVRLNLRRRDPAFTALFAGFALLARLTQAMGGRRQWTAARSQRAARRLRLALRQLHANAFNATAALLDSLRLARVDAELLKGAYQQVCAEPALAHRTIAPMGLDVQGADLWVAMPRSALNEIAVNLVRNAIQADADSAIARVELVLATEVAPITALESVVVAVRDRGPALAIDAVQHPQLDHGLGLVHSLVERYGGALDVTAAPAPWSKAVAVRLPRAYPATHEPLASP